MSTKDEINRRKRVKITNSESRGFSLASFRPRDKGMCIFIQLGDNGTQTRVLPRARHRVIFDPRRYLSTFALLFFSSFSPLFSLLLLENSSRSCSTACTLVSHYRSWISGDVENESRDSNFDFWSYLEQSYTADTIYYTELERMFTKIEDKVI